MKNTLTISHLSASVGEKQILSDINLIIRGGEIHALMGPNGAGKTSLAMVLAGNSAYKIKRGQIAIGDNDITKISPELRARKGLSVSFQKPIEIPGVSLLNILRVAIGLDYKERIKMAQTDLGVEDSFLSRSFENFSGGEGKKIELLQTLVLGSRFLVLDEIDTGLDVDALCIVAKCIYNMAKGKQKRGIILITHSPRVLRFIKPDYLHVMIKGKIVRSDGPRLIEKIEKEGYQWLTKTNPSTSLGARNQNDK